MKRKRFTEEQIIGILSEAEQAGNIREVCRLNNITEQTFYRWRTKFGGKGIRFFSATPGFERNPWLAGLRRALRWGRRSGTAR